jgi:hypothetical protein
MEAAAETLLAGRVLPRRKRILPPGYQPSASPSADPWSWNGLVRWHLVTHYDSVRGDDQGVTGEAAALQSLAIESRINCPAGMSDRPTALHRSWVKASQRFREGSRVDGDAGPLSWLVSWVRSEESC